MASPPWPQIVLPLCGTRWLTNNTLNLLLLLIHTRRDVWLCLMDMFTREKKQNTFVHLPRGANLYFTGRCAFKGKDQAQDPFLGENFFGDERIW